MGVPRKLEVKVAEVEPDTDVPGLLEAVNVLVGTLLADDVSALVLKAVVELLVELPLGPLVNVGDIEGVVLSETVLLLGHLQPYSLDGRGTPGLVASLPQL